MAGEKILIVDLNTELLERVAEQVLVPHGFKPLLAYSQNEGVKLAVSKSPDLLLLHLPLDSVAQLLQRITQTGHLLPAILMVDRPSTPVPIELLRLGVQDYVAEPYSADDILQAVRRVIMGRESRSLNFEQLAEDLTEFNQDLEQWVKKLGAIKGGGGSAGLSENVDSILNRVTEAAVSVTGADTGYLFVIDDKTDALRLRAAQNLSKVQAEAIATQLEDLGT
ncbi:MAG: hypothetical protein HYR94_13195 [Chloroflexi bacterium]|nr:hypothetical protein [Chloroflexota bacterium]